MKGYRYFLGINGKRRIIPILSSSTKIIRIGGFIAKIKGGNHPLFGRRVTKNGSGRLGLIDFHINIFFLPNFTFLLFTVTPLSDT